MEGQEDGAHALERRQSGPYTLVSPLSVMTALMMRYALRVARKLVFPGKGGKTAASQRQAKHTCVFN